MEIRVERLTEDNFNSHSLDNFIRHQVVTECLRNGFDTFGPFKPVGGINKNRPNTEDMEQAVQFYRGLNK